MNIKIDNETDSPKISAALFDLDGTILNSQEIIPDDISQRIKHISNFIPTSLISGRIFSSVYDYSKELELSSPQISDNGALIFNPINKEIIFSRSIDCELERDVFNLLDNNDFYYFASSQGEQINNNSKDKNFENVNIITCLYDDIYKFISSNSLINLSKISLIPSSGSSNEKYLSFMPKNINKGIAIEEYSSYLGINKSKIFAIGDGLNDIEMLNKVGISVAMGNSDKEVYKASKFYTKSFDENGTILALDWIIEGLN